MPILLNLFCNFHLAINSRILERYFGFLIKLDTSSKKRLIIKLTESIETGKEKKIDLEMLYGAWMLPETKSTQLSVS